MQKLVYIAGAGHSGSTLLEMFLSGAEGHVGLGEIYQLADSRNPIIDRLDGHDCSCGASVAGCNYWSPIIDALHRVPRHDEAARYSVMADAFARTYGDGAVLIDSSKTARGLAVARASGCFDIRVLHISRDVRSWLVAQKKSYRRNGIASWQSNRARDGMLKGTAKYAMRNPLADAWRWQQVNRHIDAVVSANSLPCLPVSYERLCFDTAGVKQEIEQFLGIKIAPYGDAAARAGNHSIFGNRMRFEPGKLREIRYDDGWMQHNDWLLPWTLSPALRRENSRLQSRQAVA